VGIEYVSLSSLIIDDIVLPDGQVSMNTLGGSGTHALVGMRVWSDRLAFAATVGADLDPAHRAAREQLGIDLRGLIVRDGYRTTRAWQLFEHDGRRTEILRTNLEAFNREKPRIDELPADYFAARGFHLLWGDMPELERAVDVIRAANDEVVLAWEPSPEQVGASQARYQALLPRLDLFSPDLNEAEEITGEQEPEAMCAKLAGWGARCVALRMGSHGSVVRTATSAWHVPPAPATVVDVTGGGNAYCGGFLVGLGSGLSPVEAALRGSVSASFALEQFGLPSLTAFTRREAELRLAAVRERVSTLSNDPN
jgi:sugar/nucleoside kinase (ribokinase family)